MERKSAIEKLWKKKSLNKDEFKLVSGIIEDLDKGLLSTVYKDKKTKIWCLNEHIKKAIILYIKNNKKIFIQDNNIASYDIFPNKLVNKLGSNIRFTSLSFARYGSYISSGAILMPCFVNVGARIGKNTMLDTWSTVGSCAFIGKNVHLSGGVGIGGVIEPINSMPVIIENGCFIGARSEIVEGTLVCSNSVISMGVYIGKSTRVYDRIEDRFYNSYIPKSSVVVPGSINKGKYSLNCPIIVKKRDNSTSDKVKLNSLIRKV
ncbi:2,3,4,5-tetrahydropyridine-2,6-dicarboxylate N-succinyltransferase [Candidatus Vidania fulgoroideorum]